MLFTDILRRDFSRELKVMYAVIKSGKEKACKRFGKKRIIYSLTVIRNAIKQMEGWDHVSPYASTTAAISAHEVTSRNLSSPSTNVDQDTSPT